ncbi:GNAT family N-acetyltransferase [Planococcus beigongshangi]|uniref:GNAT family N-acetyltransferase n=1 Tax=Planococcus beigongshangi TaxID=2782536 RepID=UPI00193B61DE|nr:GNAT family N-acetyltransferase [Planococcus beigongshangi]
MKDIYFEKEYGQLYEDVENGTCEVFEFKHELGKVRHLFIKRSIPHTLSSEILYDLTTPYGYGGPLVLEFKEGKKDELIHSFYEAFKQYCEANKIISEFIRFHPLLKNEKDFKNYYDIIFKRNTLLTVLSDTEDVFLREYSASCRRDIRLALKAGVEFKVILEPDDLEKFKELYYSTMKRVDAETIYFFSDKYFSECLKHFKKNIILIEVIYKGQTIGMSLNFIYKNLLHVHLTGTLQEFHHLAPAYVLQYALASWGKENGVYGIHLGGGKTGEKDDKLFLFKKKFAKNKEYDFFIGKKIWNPQLYQKLCEAADRSVEYPSFPAYR